MWANHAWDVIEETKSILLNFIGINPVQPIPVHVSRQQWNLCHAVHSTMRKTQLRTTVSVARNHQNLTWFLPPTQLASPLSFNVQSEGLFQTAYATIWAQNKSWEAAAAAAATTTTPTTMMMMMVMMMTSPQPMPTTHSDLPMNGQWWSYLTTHTPQNSQWRDRTGCPNQNFSHDENHTQTHFIRLPMKNNLIPGKSCNHSKTVAHSHIEGDAALQGDW